jgi:sulfite reductase alpha subunit
MHCLNATSPLTHNYIKDAAEGAILATGDDKGVELVKTCHSKSVRDVVFP